MLILKKLNKKAKSKPAGKGKSCLKVFKCQISDMKI